MSIFNRIGRCVPAMVILFTGALVFAEGQKETVPSDLSALVGEVVYVEGKVDLNGLPASPGDPVKPGDRILTGPGSVAEITFGSRNILQFRENTESMIEAGWAGVELSGGRVAAVLNGLDRLGFGDMKRFTVRTETAVMAVRGTTFFIDHETVNGAYFCTCNGKLHLESPDGGNSMDTEAYHHEAVWYVKTPEGIGVFPSGLHYHDDEMLNKLALKAGTRIPWKD